ncbi:hypothetical protein PIB30_074422 [Stylosanthes scabra]|uniref:TIR domain-containing protein n=1 Tax=Stylosanthes scabra TaxID=79078 RepID=A0ABU6YM82_9FABA|nr:hypothetical protein [Stylosanthes scabra]
MALLGASSSSSSRATATLRYDVFINFRGEDTRNTFTSHLHSALCRNDIDTFVDDYRIPKGDAIWKGLVEAIRDSKLFLVIFSENYASSKWCLRELAEIMECRKKNENVIHVIPVFYKIKPTDVRKQTGSYHIAFEEHKRSSDHRDVQQWRTALFEASSLSGFYCDGSREEAKLIEEIVETILPKLNKNRYRDEHKSPFICNRNYASVKSSLRLKLEKVHVIGIWGMAGIGKTTIATALFNECSSEYEGRCFLTFSKGLEGQGVNHVCARILSQLLNHQDLRIDNIQVIDSRIIRKLKHMKVFIVLDDVTNSLQILTNLIQMFHDCLGVGSRIILAARDRNVLTSGGVEEIHEVKEMDFEDSLELFSYYAFNASQPKEDYYQLSTRVVADYAQGMTLALTILGSFLKTKGEREWDSALRKLRKYPNADIQQVLRSSYDALDDDEENILLDVACFFIGHKMEEVIGRLNSFGFFADIGIKNLLDKSLISINSYNDNKFINMHALIKEMCWKISCEEQSKNGGRQTRLWSTEEVCNILQDERDIHGVESMIVDINQITIDPRSIFIALRKMPKLRLLALRGNINPDIVWNRELPEDFQLPNDLRYVEWNECPLKFVPSICWPKMLVELSFHGSDVEKLWDAVQDVPSLEKLDLRRCKRLKECPNLAGAPNLKLVTFFGCESLQDVHPSIFSHSKIEEIYVSYCTSLKRLCSDYCPPSLRGLWATGCSNLEEFSIPMNADNSKLLELCLARTALSQVPSTIMNLKNIGCFGFDISYSLEKLPPNLARTILLMDPIKYEDDPYIILSRIFPSPPFLCLKQLIFFECQSLSKLPDDIHVLQSLQVLEVESCPVITTLPESIKNLQQLMDIYIYNCEMLQYIPPLPPSVLSFCAVHCKSVETVSSSLTSEPSRNHWASFKFHNCTKLDDHAYIHVLKDLKSRVELVASDGANKNNANTFCYYLPTEESMLINDWSPSYYHPEGSSFFVAVPPDDEIISSCLVLCMLLSNYQSWKFINSMRFECSCYISERDCNERECIAARGVRVRLTSRIRSMFGAKMVSDQYHMVVWYDSKFSNEIMKAIKERNRGNTTCNPILIFEFDAKTVNNEEVWIKGCGIHWMHVDVKDEGEVSYLGLSSGVETHPPSGQTPGFISTAATASPNVITAAAASTTPTNPAEDEDLEAPQVDTWEETKNLSSGSDTAKIEPPLLGKADQERFTVEVVDQINEALACLNHPLEEISGSSSKISEETNSALVAFIEEVLVYPSLLQQARKVRSESIQALEDHDRQLKKYEGMAIENKNADLISKVEKIYASDESPARVPLVESVNQATRDLEQAERRLQRLRQRQQDLKLQLRIYFG